MKEVTQHLDGKGGEHLYLHKDFHGALCYAIKYLDETYGYEITHAYLRHVGETVYKPLIFEIKRRGLKALEDHLRRVFTLEGGEFELYWKEDHLQLEVKRCPAIEHLKRNNLYYTDRFCTSTIVVNETICRQSGCQAHCDVVPGSGRCVQTFRRMT
ncbi:hypothetical protein GF407_08965 [candidate division KSB1 bacterium]|nr:hypothetical protein [candidate division KSB1 bacterium]